MNGDALTNVFLLSQFIKKKRLWITNEPI